MDSDTEIDDNFKVIDEVRDEELSEEEVKVVEIESVEELCKKDEHICALGKEKEETIGENLSKKKEESLESRKEKEEARGSQDAYGEEEIWLKSVRYANDRKSEEDDRRSEKNISVTK